MTMILKIEAVTHARAQVLTSSPSLRERTEVSVTIQYVIARKLHSSDEVISKILSISFANKQTSSAYIQTL